jgi:hypothetical protein
MPMVSLKLMAGAARSMVVASARTTAAEIAARSRARDGVQGRYGGRTARGHTGWSHGWCAKEFPKTFKVSKGVSDDPCCLSTKHEPCTR